MGVKGKGARLKGLNFEREIANRLKEIDPMARRNVSESQEGSFDILTNIPIAIQCKCLSNWSISPHKVLEQATKHSKGRMPIGVVRISRKKPDLVVMNFDDFFYWLSATFKEGLKQKRIEEANRPTLEELCEAADWANEK